MIVSNTVAVGSNGCTFQNNGRKWDGIVIKLVINPAINAT